MSTFKNYFDGTSYNVNNAFSVCDLLYCNIIAICSSNYRPLFSYLFIFLHNKYNKSRVYVYPNRSYKICILIIISALGLIVLCHTFINYNSWLSNGGRSGNTFIERHISDISLFPTFIIAFRNQIQITNKYLITFGDFLTLTFEIKIIKGEIVIGLLRFIYIFT